MKSYFFYLCTILIFMSCNKNTNKHTEIKIQYPETKQVDTVDQYFETSVKDPYRWLEDDRSIETEAWVRSQNETTFDYLDKIPFRSTLKKSLEKLWNYEKIGSPFKEGDYTYFYKNNGLQNQYVIYRYKNDESPDSATVFLDPNTFKEDGTVSLAGLSFSKSGHLLAYSISEGGSDWRKVVMMDVASKKIIGDTLVDIKFSGLSWYKDEGFYYSSYDKPKGSALSDKTDQHKVYYHQLGTPQKKDVLIYGGIAEEKHRYIGATVTEDNRYLFVSLRVSTSGNKLIFKDLTKPNSSFIPILEHTDSDTYLIDNVGAKLFFVTNLNAPNQKIVSVDAQNPSPEHWVDFIPETKHVLSASTAGGYFFAEYMVDAISQVKQYDYDGNFIRDIKLPGIGNAGGFGGKKEDKVDFYSFTNYKTPASIYTFDIETGLSELYWRPEIDFNSDGYESKQVFYTSKDGTKIPMIITHKKGINLDGKNPTILYGYGGFNISLNPIFSVANAVWLDQGGIYAVPNLRGGGEYGKDWHIAGTQMNKQNVFDDFIAAAEYLISETACIFA